MEKLLLRYFGPCSPNILCNSYPNFQEFSRFDSNTTSDSLNHFNMQKQTLYSL